MELTFSTYLEPLFIGDSTIESRSGIKMTVINMGFRNLVLMNNGGYPYRFEIGTDYDWFNPNSKQCRKHGSIAKYYG